MKIKGLTENIGNDIVKLIVSVGGVELVGILGGLITVNSITNWYNGLRKPFFAPPNWIFGPVWTLLYGLMGIAFFLIWRKGIKKGEVKEALTIFGIHLIFNFLWSMIFFGLRMPLTAFLEILLLIILIIEVISQFRLINRWAGWLLIPYLGWVIWAAVLNLSIVVLN